MKRHLFTRFGTIALLLWSDMGYTLPSFSGDICYSVHFTKRNLTPVDETFSGKLHVKKINSKTCSLYLLAPQQDDGPGVFTGDCILADKIYVNMVETQIHTSEPWVDSEIFQVAIERDTLNGTFHQISHDYNTSTGEVDNGYASGTFTKVDKNNCTDLP